MVLLTMIGRCRDGLALTTSENDSFDAESSKRYQSEARQLFKTLNEKEAPQMTFETGNYFFHCLLENGICYLCLCERAFSERLAFSYLEEIATEFQRTYGNRIYAAQRAYTFIEFNVFMQSARKKLNAVKSRRNINMLSNELQGVQKIMVQNIRDVLQRGSAISDLDSKATNLSLMSQNYRKSASALNNRATFAKVVAGSVLFICFILYFWVF